MKRTSILAGLPGMLLAAATAHGVVIAQWNLGEDDPGAAAGALGNPTTTDAAGDFDRTCIGDPAYSSNVPAGGSTLSMQFGGTGDYYTGAAPTTDLTKDFSYSFDANFTAFGAGGFSFLASLGSNQGGISVVEIGGKVSIFFPGAGNGTGTYTPTPGEWASYTVDYVYNDGSPVTTLSVNGAPVSTRTGMPAYNQVTDYFTIGGNSRVAAGGSTAAGDFEGSFNGFIDNVKFTQAAADQLALPDPMVDDYSITEEAADVSVELVNGPAEVTVYWATTDYGTNLGDWQANGAAANLGNQTDGTVWGSLSGLTADTAYTVRFHAVNTTPDPDEEAWSAPLVFGTLFPAGKTITDLAATAPAEDRVSLTWTDGFNTEESFDIERSDDGGPFAYLATIPANATGFTDASVAPETAYQYRICAYSRVSGFSEWSNLADVTTPATPPFTPNVTADFDFEDNLVPELFGTIPYGSGPATGSGVLTFDGTTALQAETAAVYGGAAPADNFAYEVIATPTALDAFDILASIVRADGSNSGSFLFQEAGTYRLIECSEGVAAGFTAPAIGTPVALAFVMEKGTARLFVNGSEENSRAFSAGGLTPIDTATLAAVVLGGNLFDDGAAPGGGDALGAFNGTIDRFRAFTFIGPIDPAFLLSVEPAAGFAAWIAGYDVGGMTGFDDDFDGDGLGNGIENFLGTDPSLWNAGLTGLSPTGDGAMFQHPENPAPAGDVSTGYEWSPDLANWHASGATAAGTTVTITPSQDTPTPGTTTVTATASGTVPAKLFLRATAELAAGQGRVTGDE